MRPKAGNPPLGMVLFSTRRAVSLLMSQPNESLILSVLALLSNCLPGSRAQKS